MRPYDVKIVWSDDDGGFIATVPDLPGCSAYGDTRALAAIEVGAAIEAWLAAQLAAGNPSPSVERKEE